MNQKEREQVERELILDILIESTKWHVDGDDDAIRLEVCLRARRLLGIGEIPREPQSVVERGLAKLEAKNKSRDTHVGKIRIYEHGKTRWVARELCEQVPCIHSKTGLKWIAKKEVQNESQDRT